MSDFRLDIDSRDIVTATQRLIEMGESQKRLGASAQTSASAFVSAFTRIERQLDVVNKTNAQYAATQQLAINKTLGVDKAVKSASASYKVFAQSLNMADAAQEGLNTAQVAGTRRMSSMGVVTQQVGYQVGDFAVQVQSGQSALVAFSQQATQLVGVLPLMSEKLGISAGKLIGISAGLGIGIPVATALAGILWTVSQATEESAEKATRFEDALKAARSEVVGMEDDLRLLQSRFKDTFALTLSDSVEAARKSLEDAQNQLEILNNIAGSTSFFGGKRRQQEADEAIAAAEELITAREEELAAAIATADALDTLNNLHEQAVVFLEAEAEAQDEVRAAAEDTLETIAKLEEEYGEALVTALALGGVDLESNINAGTIAAGQLAVQLGVALGVAQQIQLAQVSIANKNQVYSGRGTVGMPGESDGTGAFNPSKEIQDQADILLGLKKAPKVRGGSKGRKGGGKSDRDDFIEKLREEMDVRKRLLGVYGEERDLQEEIYRITDGLGKDRSKYSAEYINNLALENIALKEQEEIFQIKRDNLVHMSETIEDSMADAFNSIRVETESVGDAFKNMAKTIIDELLQVIIVQKVVGSFGLGDKPAGGFAGAIGSIFGGFFAEGGDVNANVPIVVGEREPELFVPRSAGTIYNQKQLASMGGSNGGKQQVELILHAPEGISIETVRSEVGLQITKAGPAIVNQSVKASQNNLKNGSKASWGI